MTGTIITRDKTSSRTIKRSRARSALVTTTMSGRLLGPPCELPLFPLILEEIGHGDPDGPGSGGPGSTHLDDDDSPSFYLEG